MSNPVQWTPNCSGLNHGTFLTQFWRAEVGVRVRPSTEKGAAQPQVGARKSACSSLLAQQVAAWCFLGMGTDPNSWLESCSASISPPANLGPLRRLYGPDVLAKFCGCQYHLLRSLFKCGSCVPCPRPVERVLQGLKTSRCRRACQAGDSVESQASPKFRGLVRSSGATDPARISSRI